ncbi:TetR/AcrR family transcriptional regulator [Sphaerothrix gracilis]|uniref:TetR/AcrR family transcriptional regulator n=1 Tax=Sphaerothrix gracilis TaxID=3151835 RepID=UPI0031FDCC5D
MPRQKEFDRDEVLEKAMTVFWRQGYEATSVQDLVEAMGINRGSLYDTFQDKHSLFLAAIAHYQITVVKPILAPLLAPDAARQAIVDHFYGLAERSAADLDRQGCLMTNAMVERGAHDDAVTQQAKATLQQIEAAFYQALQRAKAKEEIAANQDLRAIAQYFACALQGLRVVAKINPDPQYLRQTAELILAVLQPQPETAQK